MQGHYIDYTSSSILNVLYSTTTLECINQWRDTLFENYKQKLANPATQEYIITLLVNGKDLNYYESIEQHNDNHVNNIINKMTNIPFESMKQANEKIEQYKYQQQLNQIAQKVQRNKQEQADLEQKERALLPSLYKTNIIPNPPLPLSIHIKGDNQYNSINPQHIQPYKNHTNHTNQ